MHFVENEWAAAQELVGYAKQLGIDLEPLRTESMFQKDQRWVFFWRKQDGLPCSGREDEAEGTLHYNIQGSITSLPSCLKESGSAFRGGWSEAGTFESLEQAVELVKAWLLDGKEVDGLPPRLVRRYQLC